MRAQRRSKSHRLAGDTFEAVIAIAITALFGVCAPFPVLAQDCPGDCSGDLVVSVDEVVACIGRALGREAVGCAACDSDGDGQVTIDEVVEIVGTTLQALVISAEGVCMRPGPDGLVSCPSGTEVSLSRCADRSSCLDDPDSRTPLVSVTTDANGNFSLMTCRGASSALLFEAAVESTPSSRYRTMDFGPLSAGFGFSAGVGRGAGRILLGNLEISPRSEAAVRLLDENGLQNFTDEGVIEIIEAVARATANTTFAGLDAAAAAELAESSAARDQVVQTTIEANRLEDVVITQEGSVQASSVFGGNNFPATLSIDGSRRTSWFSDGAAGGETETFRWTGRQDNLIGSVSVLSNRDHPQFPGFGFGSLRIDVLDVQGAVVFTRSFPLPGETDPDVTVSPNVFGRTVLLTFTGHDDPSCGGFSELIVVARR
jgi:hypothetical protein